MKIGQYQPPASRRTTTMVLMHWQASTKNTISDTPASGVISGEPSAWVAFCSDSRRLTLSSSASSMPNTMPRVETKTSRAANAPMMPTPMRQSKPRGSMVGSITCPSRPPRL